MTASRFSSLRPLRSTRSRPSNATISSRIWRIVPSSIAGMSPGFRASKADTHQTSLHFSVVALVGEGCVADSMQHRRHIICQRDAGIRGRVLRERLDIGFEAVQCVRVLPVELRAQRRVRFFWTHRYQKTRVSDS